MSCGKEKDNSHVPSGRVAHITVTQHTPDTAYRLEYTFEWWDTLLECVKCLLPDGRRHSYYSEKNTVSQKMCIFANKYRV